MGHLSRSDRENSGQWSDMRGSCRVLSRAMCVSALMLRMIMVVGILVAACQALDDVTALCRSLADTHSCSQCITRNSQCAWCTDPGFKGDFHCDLAKNLQATCPPPFLYQEASHVQLTENVAAGTYEPQYGKVRQIEPQQVHVLVRPGETVAFPLKYYHAETEEMDIYILNSDTEPNGVSLSYTMECKGVHERGQLCRRVRNTETVAINVSVTARDCTSNAVVSIGIAGLREVVALYVRPQCGCDCEKPERQEKRSGRCGEEGTLSCGVCHCDNLRKGGRRCECDLPPGISSAQLESQCRDEPDKPLCSGHGYCACGVCVCRQPHVFSGRYCECGDVACPAVNGVQCNGRGSCSCGKCQCEPGWSGPNCDCSHEQEACRTDDGSICSGHGTCTCNKCNCDSGHEGEKCERRSERPIPPDNRENSAENSVSHIPGEPESNGQKPVAEQASDSQSAASSVTYCYFRVPVFVSFVLLRSLAP